MTPARGLVLASVATATAIATSCGHAQSAREPTEPARPPDAGLRAPDGAIAPNITTIPMHGVVAVTLPTDAVCRHAVGKPLRGASGSCARDEACTERAYGRCTPIAGQNRCVYDECVADSECERRASGTICVCATSESEENRCVPGSCRSDRECAPGESCVEHRCGGR